MFQVAFSLTLAFEKLLISSFEKKAQECCIVVEDCCGKHNTSYPIRIYSNSNSPYVHTATATARVTPHMHFTCTSYVLYAYLYCICVL